MMARKTVAKSKKASPKPRVAVRFESEEDYAVIHQAASAARLSMNGWIIQVLMAAAGKMALPSQKGPWKRQENRTRALNGTFKGRA